MKELLNFVSGPDFPTGGVIEGAKEIKEAYETGKGKIIVKSKYTVEKEKGKNQIIVSVDTI